MPSETLLASIAAVVGISQIGLLTAIFFRLGRGAARIEELFRRVISIEKELIERRAEKRSPAHV